MNQKHKNPKSGDPRKIQKTEVNYSPLSSKHSLEDLNEGATPIQQIRQSSFNEHMKAIEQNYKKKQIQVNDQIKHFVPSNQTLMKEKEEEKFEKPSDHEDKQKKIVNQSTETNRDPLLIQEHLILSNYFFCVPGIGTKGFSIFNSNIIGNTDPPSAIDFCYLLSHCEKNIMDHNSLYILNEKHFVIVDKGICTVKYYLIKKYDQKKMHDHTCFLKNEGTSYLVKEGNIQKGINYTFD